MDRSVTHGKLRNGLRWVSASDPTAKTVTVQLMSLAGSRSEPEGKRGMAHLVEHLFFAGTTQHPSAVSLLQQVYAVGGELNADTGVDSCNYYCKVRPQHLSTLLSFFSEILYHSLFTPASIEIEKEVVLNEVQLRTGSAVSQLTSVMIPQRAWMGTPAEHPVGGKESDLRSVTRADVLAFVARMYRPETMVIAVSGKVTGNLSSLLSQHLDYLVTEAEREEKEDSPLATTIHQTSLQTYNLGDGLGEESVVTLGFPYLTAHLSTVIPIINYILLETMSCRLFQRLRSELGLVYAVMPIGSQLRDVGLFGFMMSCKASEARRCIDESLQVLKELVERGVSERELQQAKQYLEESKWLALEDTGTLAGYYGEQLLFGGGGGSSGVTLTSYETSIREIRGITVGDVMRGCAILFVEERMNVGVVG